MVEAKDFWCLRIYCLAKHNLYSRSHEIEKCQPDIIEQGSIIDRTTLWQEFMMHHAIAIEEDSEQNLHIWPNLTCFFRNDSPPKSFSLPGPGRASSLTSSMPSLNRLYEGCFLYFGNPSVVIYQLTVPL